MAQASKRVLFRIEVKDCVLPKAPAALVNASLSVCFEHGHKLASTTDRSLLVKGGEDPRVTSFPRESLALVVTLGRDVRGKYKECTGQIVVRMRRSSGGGSANGEASYKGLAMAKLSLSDLAASPDGSSELRLPLTQFPWPLTAAEEKRAYVVVAVTMKVVGGNGEEEEALVGGNECASAEFGHDPEDDAWLNGQGPSPPGTAGASSSGKGGTPAQTERSAAVSRETLGRPASSSHPYASAISAAISSNAAYKKKCDAVTLELRALQREHEDASKLKQALRALQAKYDAASRDLVAMEDIVKTQASALKQRVAPEVESLEAQLAASEAAVAALRKQLDALKNGKPGDAPALERALANDASLQLAAAKEAKVRSEKERDQLRKECDEARRAAEELSASLLKTRHEFSGSLSKAQAAALKGDLEMTRYQLNSSSDLIDALMRLQSDTREAVAKEADIKAILAAATARGKEYADVCQARDQFRASSELLSRQLMAALRKTRGQGPATYSSVINAAPSRESDLSSWTDAQFSDWSDSEPVIRAEVDTATIFPAESFEQGLSVTTSENSTEAILALESKLQTSSAALRLKESQLASAKASLEAASREKDRHKAEIADLTSKLQSGLAFMGSIETQVHDRDAQVAAASREAVESSRKALEWMTKYNAAEQQLSEALASLEIAQTVGSQKMKTALSSPGPGSAGSSAAEYEARLQEAAAYVAWQETELAALKQEVARGRQTIDGLERQLSLERSGGGGGGGGVYRSGGVAGNADLDELQARLQEAQEKAKLLKREAERSKLELEELQGLLEVRNDHIKSQTRRLMAFESGRPPPPDTEPEVLAGKLEGKGKKLAETKAALNRRISELEDELSSVLLKSKSQEDKLTRAAEYIKYQKEQITQYIAETGLLREQLDATASKDTKMADAREMQAEIDEVRVFAEEFEKKLVEACEFIDAQALEVTQLQAALTLCQKEKLAALSIKASLAELPKQPTLPYLSSRNDPDNIDFDECMEYLRKVDNEVARTRKQEMTLATENLTLQAALKQAVAAASVVPVIHAAPPASVLMSQADKSGSGGGGVDAQVKEAREVARRLAAENAKLQSQLEQSQSSAGGGGGVGGGGGSTKNGAKYDDFDTIVTDLINVKMELASVRNELEDAQAKNREAEAAMQTIQRLQGELAASREAAAAAAAAGSLNPFDEPDDSRGGGGDAGAAGRGSVGGGARALGGEDPLVIEARELAKRYFGELQKAKTQISTLSAELTAARVMRTTSATPGSGPLSDQERDGLVQELINTKMEIDAAINDLEDERRKSSELVSRLNESTIKVASLEARLGNSSGSKDATKTKAIARFGFLNR